MSAASFALQLGVVLAACGGEPIVSPWNGSTPAAPVISQLAVVELQPSQVTITFSTDQPSLSVIDYGASTSYGLTEALEAAPATAHVATLTSLAPATTYHYRVTAFDPSGMTASTSTGSFTTEPPPDTVPPALSSIGVSWFWTTVATLEWSTDEPTTGHVDYGTTPSYGSTSATAPALAMGHEMALTGLAPNTTYHYRVIARDAAGNEQVSDDRAFTTASTPAADTEGVWISSAELAQLPTSGPAWDNMLREANGSCGSVHLDDQDQTNNVCVMAKALVYARTGGARYLLDVMGALTEVVVAPEYTGRALALGRKLPAYVIAADLIRLRAVYPALDILFRAKVGELMTTPTTDGPVSLVDCHETRPNNWGTHCGAARAVVAAYLDDTAILERVAQIFKGWLGDRSAYAGFLFGDPSWQCDPTQPVGINPVGCTREGNPIGGVLPDDQRRAGPYVWPPPKENYVWEALQGALVQAVVLHRAGYAVWDWQDAALLRAATWLHDQDAYPAEADDTWQPHILNHYYGSTFPAPIPATPGKNVGWSDWTHP